MGISDRSRCSVATEFPAVTRVHVQITSDNDDRKEEEDRDTKGYTCIRQTKEETFTERIGHNG
jgi:hypothetical protein